MKLLLLVPNSVEAGHWRDRSTFETLAVTAAAEKRPEQSAEGATGGQPAERRWVPVITKKNIWVCLKIVYPYTQWLMIIIPIKWLFHWGYTPFSDIPIYTWDGSYRVGGLEHFFWLSIQLGISSSQLTNSIIFQRGRLKPPTSCSWIYVYIYISGWYRFDFGDFGPTPYIKNWIWKNWFAILLFVILASVRFAAIRFPRGASSCLRGSWHVSILYISVPYLYTYTILQKQINTHTHTCTYKYICSILGLPFFWVEIWKASFFFGYMHSKDLG